MSQDYAPHDESFLITFVVTYYNIPLDMLRQCVASIVALDLQPTEMEIVLVDDGSSIDPRPVVDEYAGRIRYIRQENRGVAAARNRGLDEARGTHIQFVDADDCLLKKGYEYCIALARSSSSPDIVILDYCEGKRPVPGTKEATATNPMTGAEYMMHNNLRGIDWAYLFRRSATNGLRFTEGLLHEDEEFVALLMLRAKSVVKTSAEAYFYRQREDSIVTRKDETHLKKRLADMQQIIDTLHTTAAALAYPEKQALERRVHQLSMDHIYNSIRLTGNADALENTVAWLRTRGLFPLPPRQYTLKYSLFRLATATRLGRKMLLCMLS